MNVLKKYLVATLALPLMLGSVSTFAYGGGPEQRGDMKPGGDSCGFKGHHSMFRMLNLTPEQRDEIRNIRQSDFSKMKDEMKASRSEMQTIRAEEDKLLLSKDFSLDQAMALAKKLADKQIERRVHMLEIKHKMMSVLTPEQRTKWAELRQDMPNKFEKCRQPNGPKGPKGPDNRPMMPAE